MMTGKLILILMIIINPCRSFILVYNTEDTNYTGESDCVYFQEFSTIKYCVRLMQANRANKNMTMCVHGQRWNFSKLLEKQISPWDVLSWSSSVEKADNYARIFYNHSSVFEEDSFLCNCTAGYFGKWCQFGLGSDISLFSTALERYFQGRTNPQAHQMWGQIICYNTLQCEYGMLCLDWRNICDKQQNCMNGIDEEHCDLLEFNECDDNEYRCNDGMCIPDEYWLDGKLTKRISIL